MLYYGFLTFYVSQRLNFVLLLINGGSWAALNVLSSVKSRQGCAKWLNRSISPPDKLYTLLTYEYVNVKSAEFRTRRKCEILPKAMHTCNFKERFDVETFLLIIIQLFSFQQKSLSLNSLLMAWFRLVRKRKVFIILTACKIISCPSKETEISSQVSSVQLIKNDNFCMPNREE